MSVWTDGKIDVVVGPTGLTVHRSGDVQLVLATEQLGGPLPPKKGKLAFARVRPLAVGTGSGSGSGSGPGLTTAFTISADRKLVRTALGPKRSSVKLPWDISALASADGQRVFAAYVTGTKARALTSIVLGVPPADPKGKWEHEYESDKPQKVEWPDELLWEKAPWSRKTRWTTDPDLLVVDANTHAYTVYDTASAVVGVLRRPSPQQAPEGFACVLRAPQEKGTSMAATATARGVLVAICKPDASAVICEFSDDGKLLAHRSFEAKKIGPITVAGPNVFALFEDRKLVVLDHELTPHTELELSPGLGASQVHLRPTADGSAFLLATADKILRGTAKSARAWSISEFDLSGVPAPGDEHKAEIPEAEVEAPAEPTGADGKPVDTGSRIITQAPRLSLNPNQPNDAWAFTTAGPFEIALNAVSVGGPAETGLYVEIYGDALDKGLIEPESLAIEGENEGQTKFERNGKRFLARLPEFRVPAGIEPNKDKKVKPKERFFENPQDTFLTIRLAGKASKDGAGDLAYVRVGFEGTEEGSLMRGRPVTVGPNIVYPPPKPPEPEPEPPPPETTGS
ncbi:hypothetical protein [Enhygromyxa salina]|uniref:Uncharacterized protein n=1 Tax=Enhygromyxa salina TaxID=215803 RepID=A0A2S9YS02_9BACT|nr:hypothetical protein [Enhygromyxa salina]PRQ07885.1 hypothetical protein ENSA7_23240 [Enhygromyxa salina]